MKFERIFYRCNKCGNLFTVIHEGGGQPQCCGQLMEKLLPNTQEAAAEKHIPVGTRKGKLLEVQVGEVLHPQTPEHHIAFIAIAQQTSTQWAELNPEEIPQAIFELGNGSVTLYAYCNLHGLWSAHLDDGYDFEEEACSAEFTQGCTTIYE